MPSPTIHSGHGATIGVDFMINTVEINGEKVSYRSGTLRAKRDFVQLPEVITEAPMA